MAGAVDIAGGIRAAGLGVLTSSRGQRLPVQEGVNYRKASGTTEAGGDGSGGQRSGAGRGEKKMPAFEKDNDERFRHLILARLPK